MSVPANVHEAAEYVRARSPLVPAAAIVLGSGLGSFARTLTRAVRIPYSTIPHLGQTTVPGHAGELVLGLSGAVPVAVYSGRLHLYEGCAPRDVVLPVRIASALGARALLVTNAAGSANVNYKPGDLMLISDHINLTGANPLAGPPVDAALNRFVDMTDAYDPELIAAAEKASWKLGIAVRKGVYVGFAGPSYETPAEIRMARTLGGDAVGMSTVLEVIAARQLGLRVLGISCLTNMAAGVSKAKLDHHDVLRTAQKADAAVSELLTAVAAEVASRGGARP